MRLFISLKEWNWYHWLITGLIFLLIFTLIIWQILLFMLHQRNFLEGKIINCLEIIKLLPLRQRLYRLSEIASYHHEFETILPYWIFLYEKHSQELLGLINESLIILKQDQQDIKKFSLYKLKELLAKINKLNKKSRDLLLDYENALKIELTQREQASLYKSFFNQLVNNATKLQIHVAINPEKLDYLVNVLQNMLYNFEIELTKGVFLKSYQILDKIAVGLISFTEILDKIPQLLTIVYKVIPKQLKQMTTLYMNKGNDIILQEQFVNLFDDVNLQVQQVKKLLDNLQYKKGQVRVEKILVLLANFNYQAQKEKDLKTIFSTYYESTIKVVELIENSFENLKKELLQIETIYLFLPMEKEIINNSQKLVKNLSSQMNELIVIMNQTKTNDYHQLVKLQVKILENALKTQVHLEQVYKLITQKTEEEKQLKQLLSHLGILLMQLNAKLNKITYQKIAYIFKDRISDVYNSFSELKELISISDDLQEQKRLLRKLYLLKDNIYKLHSKIKNIAIIDQLIQRAIVYGYKFCAIDDSVNNKIKSAQLIYNSANYEDALQLVLQALEYSYEQRLHKRLQKR